MIDPLIECNDHQVDSDITYEVWVKQMLIQMAPGLDLTSDLIEVDYEIPRSSDR
jgi:hypothetical protein